MSAARPDKLSLVVYSGDFDRVHYALVMASAAAAIGVPATLFFTMGACRALVRDGWRTMPVGRDLGTAADGAALDALYAGRNVGAFEELLESCVALGVRFLACEMGLRALGLARAALRDDVPVEIAGVVTFLNDASREGAVVFV
jgi:peroxiredoxin family protein